MWPVAVSGCAEMLRACSVRDGSCAKMQGFSANAATLDHSIFTKANLAPAEPTKPPAPPTRSTVSD
eukprot:3594614-Prymnesium_polylepis.1